MHKDLDNHAFLLFSSVINIMLACLRLLRLVWWLAHGMLLFGCSYLMKNCLEHCKDTKR